MGVTHVPLQFGPGGQGRHRVNDQHVNGARADEGIGDLEGFLGRIGLGNQQFVHVDAQFAGVNRVHGVLSVDKNGRSSGLLGLGHDMKGEGGLAGGFRPENLDDAAPGNPPDAGGDIHRNGAGGDGFDVLNLGLTEPHDGALPVVLLDLQDRHIQRSLFLVAISRSLSCVS